MSHIYIIAGPPGIGKSTRGNEYIQPDLKILNEDELRHQYKQKGYVDYKEYSIRKVREQILQNLIKEEDFALELNLGYESQYDYAISLKRFSNNIKLDVILFFTDYPELCQARAFQRFKNGLHLVKPEVIEVMYNNTLPLLKTNFDVIDRLILLDARKTNEISLQGIYSKAAEQLKIYDKGALWFREDIMPFIAEQLQIKRFGHQGKQNPNDSDIGPSR